MHQCFNALYYVGSALSVLACFSCYKKLRVCGECNSIDSLAWLGGQPTEGLSYATSLRSVDKPHCRCKH
eukprot:6466789-Amphidinium_carterae.2